MSEKKCSSCGSSIIWATTPAGKAMPLDAASETWWLLEGGIAIGESRCRGVVVHRSHFATCPHAERHRKAKQGERQAPEAFDHSMSVNKGRG